MVFYHFPRIGNFREEKSRTSKGFTQRVGTIMLMVQAHNQRQYLIMSNGYRHQTYSVKVATSFD